MYCFDFNTAAILNCAFVSTETIMFTVIFRYSYLLGTYVGIILVVENAQIKLLKRF